MSEEYNQYGGSIRGKASLGTMLQEISKVLPAHMLNAVGEFRMFVKYIPANEYGYPDEFEQTVWKVTKEKVRDV